MVLPEADLPSRALPFVLSVIAGSTDTISFLALNGLFTAHVTGNIVVLAAHAVTGAPAVYSYIISVPIFMLVLLVSLLGFTMRCSGAQPAAIRTYLMLALLFLAQTFIGRG